MFSVSVQRGHVIQVKGGAVHHDALIGKEFGSKVRKLDHHRTLILLSLIIQHTD